MKTNFSLRFAGIFFALLLTTTFAFSGNDYSGRGRNRGSNALCINRISGLTQEQKVQINDLRNNHQTVMDNLRQERRSTTDLNRKDQIGKQMDTQVSNHRNAMRALLNTDQQAQYDRLARNGNGEFGRRGNGPMGGTGNCLQAGNGQGRQWRGGANGTCCGRGFGRGRN